MNEPKQHRVVDLQHFVVRQVGLFGYASARIWNALALALTIELPAMKGALDVLASDGPTCKEGYCQHSTTFDS